MGSKNPLRNRLKSTFSEKLVSRAVPKSFVLDDLGLLRRVVTLFIMISVPISWIFSRK